MKLIELIDSSIIKIHILRERYYEFAGCNSGSLLYFVFSDIGSRIQSDEKSLSQ
jgi:hypothetical protein